MFYSLSCSLFRPSQKRNGRWTPEEHARFLKAIKLYGKDWKKVEKFVGTRSGSQVRSHAQKHFLKIEGSETSEKSEDVSDAQSESSTAPEILPKDMNHIQTFHLQAYLDALQELHKSYTVQMGEIYKTSLLKPLPKLTTVTPVTSGSTKSYEIAAFPFPKELPTKLSRMDYEVPHQEDCPYKKLKCS